MADNCSLCLIGVMDRLWFHQIILFSESSTTLIGPKTLKQKPQLITDSLSLSTPNISLTTPPDEEISPLREDETSSSELPSNNLLDDSNNEEEEDKDTNQNERPTRLNLVKRKARSHSSSPSSENLPKNIKRSGSVRRLYKSMSCRTLRELELEEVQGFMDLGFIFKKEHLNPRMMTVIPGLQRLELYKNQKSTNPMDSEAAEDNELREEEEERGIIRPYLSEAWLIKRPDSPLLNLRMPRASAAADMKKHLRFWARTVASVIQQES